MKTDRIKITRTTIDKLKAGPRDKFIWDSEARGLGVKVSTTGVKRWVYQYFDKKHDRDRRMTLGDATCLTPHDARKQAIQLYAEVCMGICPASKRKAERSVATMGDLFDRFMDEHSRVNNKPSTVKVNEGRINTNLKPYFSKYKVDEVTQAHIDAFKASLKDKHVTFNRCLALLKKAFKLAKRWGLRSDNPCDDIAKHKETKGSRILSDKEFALLAQGLNAKQAFLVGEGRMTSSVDALRLVACQGFRISEVRTCKWSSIKWDLSEMELEDSKTGSRCVPLGPVALKVLKDMLNRQKTTDIKSPYLCPSPKDHKQPVSYTSIREALDDIKGTCGLEKVTTHTFRRTCATALAARTNDVFGLRDAFGWKSLAMPNRYVGRAQVNARRVVDMQAQHLPTCLSPAVDEAASA